MFEVLHSFDQHVVDGMAQIRTQSGIDFFLWVSEFGRPYTLGAFTVVLALFFYLQKKYSLMAALLVTMTGTALTVMAVKTLTAVSRPALSLAAYPEIGYAFPSGHTAGAIALYGLCT